METHSARVSDLTSATSAGECWFIIYSGMLVLFFIG
jgi:hypothetical protein